MVYFFSTETKLWETKVLNWNEEILGSSVYVNNHKGVEKSILSWNEEILGSLVCLNKINDDDK